MIGLNDDLSMFKLKDADTLGLFGAKKLNFLSLLLTIFILLTEIIPLLLQMLNYRVVVIRNRKKVENIVYDYVQQIKLLKIYKKYLFEESKYVPKIDLLIQQIINVSYRRSK